MLKSRLFSRVRRCCDYLPSRLGLRVLTWLDVVFHGAEAENVHIPPLAAKAGHSVAVDVGANNGVTSSLMARHFTRAHAFEANPLLAERLLQAAPENVQTWSLGLSSGEGKATLTIPISEGVLLSGWASMEASLTKSFDKFEYHAVKTRSLDSFAFQDVGLIKIDVEGHELAVLDGARDTLRRCLPWLIVEAMGDQPARVREFLAPFGYRETTLHDLTGMKGTTHRICG